MRTKYMIWIGKKYRIFASKYLACAEADYMAKEQERVVFVETVKRCSIAYVAKP